MHHDDKPFPELDLDMAHAITGQAGYTSDSAARLLDPPPGDEGLGQRVDRVTRGGYTWGGLKMLE